MSFKKFLSSAKQLRAFGMLGMNQRNGDYIAYYNPRKNYPLVDDKLKTKQLAIDSGIAVPKLYGVIEIEQQIHDLPKLLGERDDFVIKPAQGSGGEGILIIKGRVNGSYRKHNGLLLTDNEIAHHISNILNGMYSLGGQPDKALIEQRVEFSSSFSDISYQGVPDIRTIVFRGVPVMSMIRLPTRASDGKANLHQGAIGVGINLATGMTKKGVWREALVTHHPDTGVSIEGFAIPHWDTIMSLSSSCHELVSLGYIGVDIVLDANHGPLILEVNARPGLSVQTANQQGLLPLLQKVEALKDIPNAIQDRLAISRSL